MYLRKTGTGALGGWGIHEEVAADSSDAVDFSDLRECNVLWAVGVPGEARWCAEELDGPLECKSVIFASIQSTSQPPIKLLRSLKPLSERTRTLSRHQLSLVYKSR